MVNMDDPRNQPQVRYIQPQIVSAQFGPWYATITPTPKDFEILLHADILDDLPQRPTTDYGNAPAVPWHSTTLRGARRIARRELRAQRRVDRKLARQASFVDAGPIRIPEV